MSNTEDKLSNISAELCSAIEEHGRKADEAFKGLGHMGISNEQFRAESEAMSEHVFVGGYLGHFLTVINDNDIKRLESALRFHRHQLREKGSNGDDAISKAQREVADVADGILARYFED